MWRGSAGSVGLGMAWYGAVGLGVVWQAWLGPVWLVTVGLGSARRGKDFQTNKKGDLKNEHTTRKRC